MELSVEVGNSLVHDIPLNDLLFDQTTANPSPNTLKWYLNILFFDEQFNFICSQSQYQPMNEMGVPRTIVLLGSSAIKVPGNGYAYIYVSNESRNNVLVDNFQVVHQPGRVIEETHYYPFGLIQQGISSKAAGIISNRIKYSGKEEQRQEFSDGSGLELTDFGARLYDNQIGRWHVVDPMAEKYEFCSPYHFAANNPMLFRDKDGKEYDISVNNVPYSYQQQTVNGQQVWGFFDANNNQLLNNAWANSVTNSLNTMRTTLTGEALTRFNDMMGGGNHLIYDANQAGQGNGFLQGNFSTRTQFFNTSTDPSSVRENTLAERTNDPQNPIKAVDNGTSNGLAQFGGKLLGQSYAQWNGNPQGVSGAVTNITPFAGINNDNSQGNANILDHGQVGNGTTVYALGSEYQRAKMENAIISQQGGTPRTYFVGLGWQPNNPQPYRDPVNGTLVHVVYKIK